MVNPDLRERWYQQFMVQAITPLEHYLRARIEMGHMRPINVPLAVRRVQGMFLGLLILRTLGDAPLLSGWDELPDVLTTIIFDGLSLAEGG
jgi:hypothetical protein